jgi:hypothetical protein
MAVNMSFDHDTFLSTLAQYSGITLSESSWTQWSGTNGQLNMEIDYSKNDYDYRTWYQEISVMIQGAGMLVSCKVDFVRTTYDDHITLMVGFAAGSSSAEPAFAQASVQFTNTTDSSDYSNVIGAPVRVDTNPDLAEGIYDTLNSQISTMNFGSTANNEARQTLPDIARANVEAIIAAATFSVS